MPRVKPADLVQTIYIDNPDDINNFLDALRRELEDALAKGERVPTFSPWRYAYSTPSLPLIPEQACHPFQTKAATDSRAKLPHWQIV